MFFGDRFQRKCAIYVNQSVLLPFVIFNQAFVLLDDEENLKRNRVINC